MGDYDYPTCPSCGAETSRGCYDFCPSVTVEDLRKEVERLREHCDRMASLAIDNARDVLERSEEIDRLRGALKAIGYGPPKDGDSADVVNQFIDIARDVLKEKE